MRGRHLLCAAFVALYLGAPLGARAESPVVVPRSAQRTPCSPLRTETGGRTVFKFTDARAECAFDPGVEFAGGTFDILAVGGGGGGTGTGGAGGGGGEVRELTSYSVPASGVFHIKVGNGGLAGQNGLDTSVVAVGSLSLNLLVAKAGSAGAGLEGPTGSGGAAGTGGSGGSRLGAGKGGDPAAQMAMAGPSMGPNPVPRQGTVGAAGSQWSLTWSGGSFNAGFFGGGGGGGICVVAPNTVGSINSLAGGQGGGGRGAGNPPTPPAVPYGTPGGDNSGGGGGGGAGCSGGQNGAGGAGGSGIVIVVARAPVASTTTTIARAPTVGATTTTTTASSNTAASARTSTTVAGSISAVARTSTTLARVATSLAPSISTVVGTPDAITSTSSSTTTTDAPSTSISGTRNAALPETSGSTPGIQAVTEDRPGVLPVAPRVFADRATRKFFNFDASNLAGTTVAGSAVAGSADGLLPGSTMTVVLRSDPVVLGEFSVAADGTANFSVNIPGGLESGNHSLSLEGTAEDGLPISSVVVFAVDAGGTVSDVVEAAETVSGPLDDDSIDRSIESGVPVYDTARHVSETVTIAATGVVVWTIAGAAAMPFAAGGAMGTTVTAAQSPNSPGGSGASTGAGSSPPGQSRASGNIQSGSGSTAGSGSQDSSGREQRDPQMRRPAGRRPDEDDSGQGDHERDEDSEGSFSATDANLLEDEASGLGDRFGLWQIPGYGIVDRFLRRSVPAASSRTILGTRILQDGHWMRAMFGVISPLLWIVGLVLGATAAAGNSGIVTAPGYAMLATIVALSLLDAMTGASAWLAFVLVSVVTGNVTSLFDTRTLLGLGILFVALPSIGSNIRPFIRNLTSDRWSVVDRVADYVMMPVFLAFAASSTYEALNGLSGLQMVDPADASRLKWVVLALTYARLLGEDTARVFFPARSATVRVEPVGEPSIGTRVVTVVVGAGLYLLGAAPFFGLGWQTWLMVALVTLVPIVKLRAEHLPNLTVVHRWFPRGILRTVLMMLVTAWFGRLVFSVTDNPTDAKSVAVLLLMPGILVGLVDVIAREGGDWQDNIAKRLGGLGLWAVAVAVLSGTIAL